MNKLTAFAILDSGNAILAEEINRHPVFAYGINTALGAEQVEQIVVYTDKEDWAQLAADYGARTELRDPLDHGNIRTEMLKSGAGPCLELSLEYPLLRAVSLDGFIGRALKSGGSIETAMITITQPGGGNPAVDVQAELEKYELLRIEDSIDLATAEALVRSDYGDNHPIRRHPPYKIEIISNRGKPRMLFCAPYEFFPDPLKERLQLSYDLVFAFNAPRDKVEELLPDVDIWFTGTCPPYLMDAAMIDRAAALKIMATPSTGTNHLDKKHAEDKGVIVLSIKESPVIEKIYASSEFSFSLLLAMINKVPLCVDSARHGTWREKEHEFRSIELCDKTIGLVGFGRIGKKMARFAESFDMNVLAYDPFVKAAPSYVRQVDSLDELLASSHIVSLHYHLDETTVRSFGAEQFGKMKKSAYFLNTARGELVDEAAMIQALDSGRLAAAAVDVITDEYILDKWNHPVIKYAREHNNLLVSPHVAGCTVESESKAATDLLSQIEKEVKNWKT